MSPSALVKSSVPLISLSYDVSNSESSARELLVALNPDWATSEGPIEFVRFKDGITNTLFKAIKRRPGHTEEQIDDEAILLRAYGNQTDILIDRDRETQSHTLLAKAGLAPPLYARFNNGLLYKFIAGYACTPEDMARSDVWPSIARLLGTWHAVLPTSSATDRSPDSKDKQYDQIKSLVPSKPLPHIWSVMQKWINALPSKTNSDRDQKNMLQAALEQSTKSFGSTEGLDHGDYIMSHCDLLSGNVIVRPGTNQEADGRETANVSFIDYEYTTPGPAAFDIANHFAEYAGFECKYNLIPTRQQRRNFITEYVRAYRQHSKPATNGTNTTNGVHMNGHTNGHTNGHAAARSEEDEVDRLMKEVDAMRGLPGLYWGIWALIQAMISQIDFNYPTYAKERLSEYEAWKEETDGSRAREEREPHMREKRWAMES